jgi:hypothetical protein
MATDARPAFIEHLREFSSFDDVFIKKLEQSLVPINREKFKTSIAKVSAQEKRRVSKIHDLLEQLATPGTINRHTVQRTLANQIARCSTSVCYKIINDAFESHNLITSERYNLAMGIAVALSYIGTYYEEDAGASDYKRTLIRHDKTGALKTKLESLLESNNPMLQAAAKAALKGYRSAK